MAGESANRGKAALVLGVAWLVVILALTGLGLAIQFLGKANGPNVVLALDLKKLVKIEKPAPPPPPPPPPPLPVLYETPPGGIVAATLTPEEKTAMIAAAQSAQASPPAAASPPGQTQSADTAPAVALPPAIGGVAVANPANLEKTPQGYLPRIADNGIPPMRAYAVPTADSTHPRIAIVIGGLGISAKATAAAINLLPPGVTLAFAPYANDVQRWVALARQRGHEVLLQVPMEPYDFPDSDPGQYTLRTGIGEESNTKRLVWALTRITGYVGVTNMLGGRYLSDASALEPTLTYLSRRGLLFYDNGAANRSVAPDVAARLGSPFVQASMTIDSIQAAMEIDHHLADLENEARTKGKASGFGFLYPVTVERVTVWAHTLNSRGLVLVPVSALVSPAKK